MVLTRLREYWEMEELDFSNFTEVDVNSLGTFLRGLAQEELKKLPQKILLTAIRRLGEQTGLPEDKLKARAYLAVELFKVRLSFVMPATPSLGILYIFYFFLID